MKAKEMNLALPQFRVSLDLEINYLIGKVLGTFRAWINYARSSHIYDRFYNEFNDE